MRYVKFFLLVTLIPFLMGNSTKEETFTKGIKPGYLAPEINKRGVDIRIKSNEYVLLQFWAAYDGESRKQNILFNNEICRLNSENLKMISISFDEKKSVFEQTVKADKLNIPYLFYNESGKLSGIYKSYHLEDGFSNMLINPQGVIIAKNISTKQMIGILKAKGVI